jgi:hypothetical protein
LTSLAAARDFVYREARVLEQRLFATLFDGAPPDGVTAAVAAYRNDDGGFGHGLEPDKRCPASQPLDVEFALETLDLAGAPVEPFARGVCDFMASVADERGAVPVVLPSVAAYPRANHWRDGRFPPGLDGTAGTVALLLKHGVEHPWISRAAEWCLEMLELEPPRDAHAIRTGLLLLEQFNEQELVARTMARLPSADYFRADAASEEYGLSPLAFAPDPESPRRAFFDDALIEAHLDRLEAEQADDGGWPISWEPPSAASALEWRGRWTVDALRVLRAYGRLG